MAQVAAAWAIKSPSITKTAAYCCALLIRVPGSQVSGRSNAAMPIHCNNSPGVHGRDHSWAQAERQQRARWQDRNRHGRANATEALSRAVERGGAPG